MIRRYRHHAARTLMLQVSHKSTNNSLEQVLVVEVYPWTNVKQSFYATQT